MQVIKKNLQIEEFDSNKIKNSINSVANEIKEPLNESDIELLSNEIKKELIHLRNKRVSTYEISTIIIKILKNSGFEKIAKEYLLFNYYII